MQQIKFITLNMLYGGMFFDHIQAFLNEEKPDILALQEVYAGKDENLPRNLQSINELKKILPSFFYHFAPEFRHIRKEGAFEQGNAIFSRFPIRTAKTVFYDVPYDDQYIEEDKKGDHTFDPHNLHTVQIQMDETTLHVVNTHGIWGLDGADNDRRLTMSQTIIDTIKDKENVILSGDFNLKPNTKTIKNIEKHLHNVFGNELTSTFNMQHKTNPGYATAVVDMILISQNFQIIEKHMSLADVSDHRPLVCTLELKT